MQMEQAALSSIDFEPISNGLVERDGLAPAQAEKAVELYKHFLGLAISNPGAEIAPPALADKAWHRHILNMPKYIEDCEVLFGGLLVHDPETYLTPNWMAAWLRTREYFAAQGIHLNEAEGVGEDRDLDPRCCFMPRIQPLGTA